MIDQRFGPGESPVQKGGLESSKNHEGQGHGGVPSGPPRPAVHTPGSQGVLRGPPVSASNPQAPPPPAPCSQSPLPENQTLQGWDGARRRGSSRSRTPSAVVLTQNHTLVPPPRPRRVTPRPASADQHRCVQAHAQALGTQRKTGQTKSQVPGHRKRRGGDQAGQGGTKCPGAGRGLEEGVAGGSGEAEKGTPRGGPGAPRQVRPDRAGLRLRPPGHPARRRAWGGSLGCQKGPTWPRMGALGHPLSIGAEGLGAAGREGSRFRPRGGAPLNTPDHEAWELPWRAVLEEHGHIVASK